MNKKQAKRIRILGKILFILYIGFLIYFLFLSDWYGREGVMDEYRYNLELFKEINRFITYREELGAFAVFSNLFGNILIFMPFGFFLYLSKASPLSRITLRGFLLSLSVEVCQYVFYLGLFEWDDMLHNSLGCLMGAACGKFIKTVWKLHRLHKLHGRKERE